MINEIQFILASQSPRRAELLGRLGYRFSVQPADIDETPLADESPEAFVRRMAREKAAAVPGAGKPVLGADTVVVAGSRILGKPRDQADALAMLALLSGGRHRVLTAVSVHDANRQDTIMTETEVEFCPVSEAEARAYWVSGESEGKAGAYAIQGLAEAFISEIHGSYSGVVGLPLHQTASLLKLFGIQPPKLAHE